MKKMILGAFGALALCVGGLPASAMPAGAAPAIEAPIQPAPYRAGGSNAVAQTVQYRPYGYRAPPRRYYRPHRRFVRPPVRGYYGRGVYRGPGPRPGYNRY